MPAATDPPPPAKRRTFVLRDDPCASERDFTRACERWRDEVVQSGLYEVAGVRRGLHFTWDALELGGASLVAFDATGLTYARDRARLRADGVDTVRVQLTERGGFRGRLGEMDVVATPGTAVFCDQTLPLLNESADTRGLTLELPRAAFGGADVRGLHGRLVSGAAFRRLHDYAAWLTSAAPAASAAAAGRVAAAMGAVVRATFERDAAAEAELQEGGALDGLAVARLRALAVDPALSRGRSAAELARALGVSRSGLYRAAAPFGGVWEVVWAARLEAAAAALVDPDLTGRVEEIALACGFADAQHFQRRFRGRFGFNPSDLRPIRLPERRAARPVAAVAAR